MMETYGLCKPNFCVENICTHMHIYTHLYVYIDGKW